LAALEKRIVITMDKDFGELVYHSGMDHSGILLLSPVPLISHSPITPCAVPNALCFHRMKLHRI
jgi:hypothetical protein